MFQAIRESDEDQTLMESSVIVIGLSHPEHPSQQASTSALSYNIASTHSHALSSVPASKIIEGHHASQLLKSLTTYLHAHSFPLMSQHFDMFDLYKRIMLQLPAIPQVSKKDLKNIVCATPPVPAYG